MNKFVVLVLFVLLGAAVYTILAVFDPLPPYTTAITATVEGIAEPIVGFFRNPAILATAASVAGGAVVNYVQGKIKEKMKAEADTQIGSLQTQVNGLYSAVGQKEQEVLELQQKLEAAKPSLELQEQLTTLQSEVTTLQNSVAEKDQQIEELGLAKDELERALAKKHIITKTVVH